jgi:exopolysaccharide biosynthesis polyprenyl glycosylphosphotransferase
MRIFNVELRSRVIFLAALDVLCVMTVTNYILLLGKYNSNLTEYPHTLVTYIFLFCILMSIFLMGLYQRSYILPHKLFKNLFISFGIAILLIPFALSILTPEDLNFAIIGTILLANFSVILLVRIALSATTAVQRWKKRVLVLGDDSCLRALGNLQRKAPHAGFLCVGALTPTVFSKVDWQKRVFEIVRSKRPHEIVFPSDLHLDEKCWAELVTLHFYGIKVSSYADFVEREFRRLELDDVNALKHILAHGSRRGPWTLFAKRVLDIVVSATLLILFLPLMTIAALAIWAGDRGPILYRQQRTGLGNIPFEIFKFRSMRCDAEADGRARWASKHDSRITRVGAVLRRSRVDEIPQLINVLRGDMSLVGPRPERPAIVETLQQAIPLYDYRHLVRPGVTGWAQINYPYGSSVDDAIEKTRYDLYYIKNGNIILDIAIIIQTVRVILLLEGL